MSKSLAGRIRDLERRMKKLEGRVFPEPSPYPPPTSLQMRVIGVVLGMIRAKYHRPVTSQEILKELELPEYNIELGENRRVMLAAMLAQEVKKRNTFIRRVSRGVYDQK